jgi:hypothetical protein
MMVDLLPGEKISFEPPPRPALLHLQSRAGHTEHKVSVLGETPKRFRVRFEEDVHFGLGVKGTTRLVPKHAVTFPRVAR